MARIVIAFLLSMSTSLCFSQVDERFYKISRRDGLASGSITAMVQDNRGIMWIGTKKGLNRYDGSQFLHFNTGNSKITSNDISTLLTNKSNQLLIGTFGSGLHSMNLSSNSIEKINSEYLGERINATVLSNDSSVWILSEKGLCSLKYDSIQPESGFNQLINNRGSALFQSQKGLWVGTNNGELYFLKSKSELDSFSFSAYQPNMFIQKIHPVSKTVLLIGTRQHGLFTFHLDSKQLKKVKIDAIDIRDVVEDTDHALWIGTDGNGVYKMVDGKIDTNYVSNSLQPFSLVSNAIQVCFQDRNKNLWFGSAWDGISFLDHRLKNISFHFSDFKGINPAGVLSIYNENNNLLFGTDGSGLSINTQNNISNKSISQIPGGSYVQFIDKIDNSLWIGTFQSGFYIVDMTKPRGIQNYSTANGLSHDDVRKILRLDKDRYLIATWGGGLNIFNRPLNKFETLSKAAEYPKDIVTIHRLNNNEILVGTFGQGVFKLNLKNFSYQRIFPHLQNVVAINHNDDGVFLGSWGQGLHLANDSLNRTEIIANNVLGKKVNVVSIINAFEKSEVWVSTTENVFRIRGKKIDELPAPPQQYHINSAFKSKEHLFFGGTEGVISFKPSKISLGQPVPVEILEVKILNKTIDDQQMSWTQGKLPTFNYDQNMITFNYSSPTYPNSRDESFEVRLDPIQKEWVNVDNQRAMTYADLNNGDYNFRVRNVSSKIERNFEFKILRPWWKTWWAYTISSVLFIGLLYSFRMYSVKLERIKNQLEIEKIGREKELEIGNIKQRFFVNVSHEIRTPLTLIIGEIEQISLKAGSSKLISNSLNSLRNNGNHLIQLVDELLDFRKLNQEGIRIKVAEGNFVNFSHEIFLSFLNKAEAQGINYVFVSEEKLINLWYDRDQLEKVFYNLISNALKNTPEGGEIRFIICDKPEEVEVIVEDTGKGIPKENVNSVFERFYQDKNDSTSGRGGFGIGLSIVQEITKLHKGSVFVDSELGRGSKFIVRLKKGNKHFKSEDLIPGFVNSEAVEPYRSLSESDNNTLEYSSPEVLILVVEDNAEIRSFLATTLSSRFSTLEAGNGTEALEVIQDQLPDLIISDVMMPEMDGITLTRKLKKDPLTSHIPVILLTARTGTVFKKESFETGADDYITKPFSPSLLITRIKNILKARENLKNQIRNDLATKPNDLNLTTPDEQFLKNLVQIIESNLDNSELNANLVATEMGMSHSVIYKKIKALTGYNLVEFVRDYRLQQAGQMLSKYKLSVTEACYKVGFSDKKYFSQIFKKKFGLSPSEYAKK